MRDFREVQQAAKAREARKAYNERQAVQGFDIVEFDNEMSDADIVRNRIVNHPDVQIHTVYPNSDYFSNDRNIEFNGNAFKAAFKAGSAFYAQFDTGMAEVKPVGSIIDIAIMTAYVIAVRVSDAIAGGHSSFSHIEVSPARNSVKGIAAFMAANGHAGNAYHRPTGVRGNSASGFKNYAYSFTA